MTLRNVDSCANCKNLFVARAYNTAGAVCKIDGHKVSYSYKKICENWEKDE